MTGGVVERVGRATLADLLLLHRVWEDVSKETKSTSRLRARPISDYYSRCQVVRKRMCACLCFSVANEGRGRRPEK